jgi:hypothetical protein
MVITRAGVGLRIAELLALRVQDVDFLRRTMQTSGRFCEMTRAGFHSNTKITTNVGVAEHGLRVPLRQGQKVPVDHGYVMQTASATLKAVP